MAKLEKYKTMEDCWEAIKKAKDDMEVERLFTLFPKEFGEWYIDIEYNSFFEKCYVVSNSTTNVCMTLELEVE